MKAWVKSKHPHNQGDWGRPQSVTGLAGASPSRSIKAHSRERVYHVFQLSVAELCTWKSPTQWKHSIPRQKEAMLINYSKANQRTALYLWRHSSIHSSPVKCVTFRVMKPPQTSMMNILVTITHVPLSVVRYSHFTHRYLVFSWRYFSS